MSTRHSEADQSAPDDWGTKLRKLREEADLTLRQVGNVAEVSFSTIARLETGFITDISTRRRRRILDALVKLGVSKRKVNALAKA